jgi:hypothetical protein
MGSNEDMIEQFSNECSVLEEIIDHIPETSNPTPAPDKN